MIDINYLLDYILDYFFPLGPTIYVWAEEEKYMTTVEVSTKKKKGADGFGVRCASRMIFRIDSDAAIAPKSMVVHRSAQEGTPLMEIAGQIVREDARESMKIGAANLLMEQRDEENLSGEVRLLIDREAREISLVGNGEFPEDVEGKIALEDNVWEIAHTVITQFSRFQWGNGVKVLVEEFIKGKKKLNW